MRVSNLIKRPIVTEKAVNASETGKYTFEVDIDASKGAVIRELKRLYDVDGVDATVTVVPGKRVRISKTFRFTRTPKWKKIVVSLKKGQKIDLFDKA
ncbi:MAG: 50S ribosomal protein L23 [Patescibacteria group bacterium]|jgi:large subunit ribosomal protein L23